MATANGVTALCHGRRLVSEYTSDMTALQRWAASFPEAADALRRRVRAR